jgi:hypothetical protein
MDALDCAEDRSSSKIPFLDCTILRPGEEDLITGPQIRVKLEAIYRIGVETRGSP